MWRSTIAPKQWWFMACQKLWLCHRHTWNCAQFPVIVQFHLIWVISHIFFVFNYPIFGVAHSKLWQCAMFLAILNHEFQWIWQKRRNTNESHQLKSWPKRKRDWSAESDGANCHMIANKIDMQQKGSIELRVGMHPRSHSQPVIHSASDKTAWAIIVWWSATLHRTKRYTPT